MKIVHANRNIPVDTLRGIACIFLVAYHVIGTSPENGLRLHEGFLKDANQLLAYVRMPLFTFLSGYVYAWRPYKSDWKKFMQGKIRRLIVPMLFVGTVFALFQALTPGTNASVTDWRFLHLLPVAHYWFIESLFLIFIILLPLEHFRLLDSRAGLGIAFLIAAILNVSNIGTPWFSIAGAFYLLPYFLFGLFCFRFPLNVKYSRYAGYFILVLVILFLVFYGQQYGGGRRSFNSLVIGILSCGSLLFIGFESRSLAAVGFYSYTIYLFHVFFTAASRIFFRAAGVSDIWVLFLLGTVIGLAGPILVDIVASKYDVSRLLMLGKGPRKKRTIPPNK
ncbi:MAG: acyltransferase [Chlorobiaceae bacterium]|nr:acyltransferase [Chlorobiaceae bacterium]NTV60853.1 acyltransferase [Chlorobiaceae bacterium]